MGLRRSRNIKKDRREVYSITNDPAYKGIIVIGSKGAINHLKRQLRK